jgi:hypothetical protein
LGNLKPKSSFSKKRLLLLGFLFVILLVIPLTVYLVGQQQDLRSRANPTTTLSFIPKDQPGTIGESINFDVWVSPGDNLVSFIKLVVAFDSTKLKATKESFEVNDASNLSIMEGPVLDPAGDKLSVVLSVENNSTNVIQQDTKIGTITFEVIGAGETSTQVSFVNPEIEIRSLGSQDKIEENVYLNNGEPATVTFQTEGELTPSPGGTTLTPNPTISPRTTITQTPITSAATATPTSSSSGGVTPSQNQSPVCESLITDRSPEGTAPLSITFTANGSDADGSISKATFSFGDGTIVDETVGGGIGTDTVNVQKSHTYNNAGEYTASVLLTDNNDGVSENANCAVTVTVSGGSGSSEISPLPDTGPSDKIVGIGALGGILFLIGALLFFAL